VSGRDTGERVWMFDPQHIAREPQTWAWEPIAELAGVEDAERLASQSTRTVDADKACAPPLAVWSVASPADVHATVRVPGGRVEVTMGPPYLDPFSPLQASFE